MPALSIPEPASSLEKLMAEHSDGVFRYLRCLVRDPDTARDLLQETFLRLIDQAATAGRPLVYTTARNCALDHLRRKKVRRGTGTVPVDRQRTLRSSGHLSHPDAALADKQLGQDILAALAEVPEDQRTVFHLSEIEGLPYAEIAELMGVGQGTIASRKHHAVRKLRRYLRRLGYEA